MLTTFLRLLLLGIAASLLLAACGNDEALTNGSAPTAPADDDTGEHGGDRAIEGPLVFVSGLGLYAAATDGSGNRIDFVDVDNTAIGIAPAIDKGSDVAYVFTYAAMEDESFSNDVFLSRLDLRTGENERFAELGYDLESDGSEELFQYREIAVAGGDAWVVRSVFGDAGSGVLLRVDGETGAIVDMISRPGVRNLMPGGDRLYFWSDAGIDMLDAATGQIETLLPANTSIGELLAGGVDISAAFATRRGQPVDDDFLERALQSMTVNSASTGSGLASVVQPLRFMELGDGAIWFQWSVTGSAADGDSVLGEAVFRFDLQSRRIDRVVPTIGIGEHFLEERAVSVAGGDLAWHAGALWVSDPQSNGAILRIDGNGDTAELVHEPCSADYLCDGQAAIVFNRTAPGQLWVMFARMEDRGGGSRVGEVFVQRLDETTGEAMLEVSVLELAGIR